MKIFILQQITCSKLIKLVSENSLTIHFGYFISIHMFTSIFWNSFAIHLKYILTFEIWYDCRKPMNPINAYTEILFYYNSVSFKVWLDLKFKAFLVRVVQIGFRALLASNFITNYENRIFFTFYFNFSDFVILLGLFWPKIWSLLKSFTSQKHLVSVFNINPNQRTFFQFSLSLFRA